MAEFEKRGGRLIIQDAGVADIDGYAKLSDLTIIDLPSFKADPKRHGVRSDTIIAIDFSKKIILIGNSSYAGEMKKSVFTYLNYVLPAQKVMPMHCSANVGREGDVAVFFGLSGTGKTTLSADPKRTLIGDDEHGWGKDGIFNFEGGCYAKTIKLSQEAEPMIWDATNRFGAVLENVAFDPVTRVPDYDDGSKTENTRSAYPLDFIPNASRSGRAGHRPDRAPSASGEDPRPRRGRRRLRHEALRRGRAEGATPHGQTNSVSPGSVDQCPRIAARSGDARPIDRTVESGRDP